MAELQKILERRRSSADQHVCLAVGRCKPKQEKENLAFRSGWSSTPDCAGRASFDMFTPRTSFEISTPRSDDDNRRGAPENENMSDSEVGVDLMKGGDVQLQRALEVALAERDVARLDVAIVRGELTQAREEIEQMRESLKRMSSSTGVLLGALHEQQLELSKQAAIEEEDHSPFIIAALRAFDLLDLDEVGQLSPVDIQVFAELMTPPKDSQGPEVLCQRIWQQLGMTGRERMGRSEWLQLIRAKNGSALGKPLSIADLERLVSSLEALEAAGMRRF